MREYDDMEAFLSENPEGHQACNDLLDDVIGIHKGLSLLAQAQARKKMQPDYEIPQHLLKFKKFKTIG